MSRFKTDENLPLEVAELLHQAGYDVESVVDERLSGQPDSRIVEVCRAEGRALVTLDLDFADIRAYSPAEYAGLVVLRPGAQSLAAITRLTQLVIALLRSEPLAGRLWVVDESQVRIRE